MFLLFLVFSLIYGTNAAPSAYTPSSRTANSTSGTSSWRNSTVVNSGSQPTAHFQDGSITGPAYYLTTETSSYIQTKTLKSGLSETVTLLDGDTKVELGPAIFTDLNVETYVRAHLFSTPTPSYHPWDPRQFSALWSMPEDLRSGPPSLLSSWSSYTNYARQSACTEDFSKFVATQPVTSITALGDIFHKNPTTVGDDVSQGYTRAIQTNADIPHCCGNCEFVYIKVQLFYWPAQHPNTACYKTLSGIASATSQPKLRERAANSSITSAPKALVYATDEDGFTYTSPSLYIKFPSLEAGDGCGSLGVSSFTSATLAFAPGELSTLVNWCPGHGCTTSLQPFDPADMPCGPPEPVGGRYGPGGPGDYSPVFASITKLNQLRPEWWNCTADIGWNGWDPPRTLEPATAMVDPVTSVGDVNAQPTNAAPSPTIPSLPIFTGSPTTSSITPSAPAPAQQEPLHSASRMVPDVIQSSVSPPSVAGGDPMQSKLADSEPHITSGDPSQVPQTQAPVKSGNGDPTSALVNPDPTSPTQSAPAPYNPSSSDDGKSLRPSQDPQNSQPSSQGPAVVSGSSNSIAVNPVNGGSSAALVDSGNESPASTSGGFGASNWAQPAPRPGQSTSQVGLIAVGGFTFSAISSGIKQDITSPLKDPGSPATQKYDPNQGLNSVGDPWPNVTPTSQVNLPQASGLVIGGSTLLPGGPALSISGTPISLAPSHIIIGQSTMPLPSAPSSLVGPAMDAPPPAPATFAFAGQTYTANPSGISIGDKTLLPGGPGVSISGTQISLASSKIIIGASTISLPSPPPPPQPQPLPTFSIAGQMYTANPGGFAFGSTSLLPGAAPISVSGTPVFLGSSALVIGTSTLLLSPTAPSNSPTTYITIGSDTFALGASDIAFGGTTLTPGAPAVTANGVPISLGSSMLILGTRTESFAQIQPSGSSASQDTSEGNVGDMIMSGLGAIGGGIVSSPSQTGTKTTNPTPTGNTASVKPFTGTASRQRGSGRGQMSFMSLVATLGFVAFI